MLKRFVTIAAIVLSCQAAAAPWPRALPDPCTNVRDRGDLNTTDFPSASQTNLWDVAYPNSYAGMLSALRGVIFIVNANGASEGHYRRLGEHLARQDFLVRLIARPGADFATTHVANAMHETFAQFGLPVDFPVVLLGHSKGGGSVLEVTRMYHDAYNIGAVINLAPNAQGAVGFLGSEAPAYLGLYGSQDEDMQGTSGNPREAFMAYDLINGEWTTASPLSRWFVVNNNMIDKAMVYVRGADHSGFIRHEGLFTSLAYRDYLSRDDQFCIAKAYTTAFLDWKLGGIDDYRAMFYGDIRPPSVAAIHTDAADYFGNPAGQPVEIFHQFSPRKRYVLADFWSTPALTTSFNMQATTLYPFAQDSRARHETRALRLAWQSHPSMRALTIAVPSNRRRLSAFDTLQFRIGQINTGQATSANTDQSEPTLLLSLVDGNGYSVNHFISSYGRIPGHDRRQDGSRGHSHMNTIRIPMADLDSINLADVRQVKFWVFPNSRGEVMIDSIEAVYDY
ncbi:MAG: hypothetical protein KDI48_09925 [Xanthomonadales bacterium]|nr:hypothetical protein [Xanthomonadales bacterium]